LDRFKLVVGIPFDAGTIMLAAPTFSAIAALPED
jgi:hypothetical protein